MMKLIALRQKKTTLPVMTLTAVIPGNPAILYRPVAFRHRLAAGLALFLNVDDSNMPWRNSQLKNSRTNAKGYIRIQ
jgi:hypothetical protein